jgi:hypothetical protein
MSRVTNALFDLLIVRESILTVPAVVALARVEKAPPTVREVFAPVIATESE